MTSPDTSRRPRADASRPGRLRVCAAVLALGVSVGLDGVAQDATPEYQLKAAFIARFPEFTEWPASALEARRDIEICVTRPSPFGGTLSEFAAGEVVRDRTLVVREIGGPADVKSCLVLFVSSGSAAARQALLAATRTLPILTIGEASTFLAEGGIVHLRLVGGRVRFDIDVAVADRVGIRFSSQLLRLALNVHGAPS